MTVLLCPLVGHFLGYYSITQCYADEIPFQSWTVLAQLARLGFFGDPALGDPALGDPEIAAAVMVVVESVSCYWLV